MVEGYIGELKTTIKGDSSALGKFGTVRVGRYIKKKKELIQLQIKEIDVGYAQAKFPRKVTKKVLPDMLYDDLTLTSENWRGKGKDKEKKKKKDSLFFSSSQQ